MTRGKAIAMIFGGAWVVGILFFAILSPSFRKGKELLRAAESGNTTRVSELLESGASLFNRDHDGHSALWLAAYKGHTEVVKLLLEHKAVTYRYGYDLAVIPPTIL